MTTAKRTVLWLFVFSVVMAYFEAAVVVYLRLLHYPEDVTRIFPLRFLPDPNLVIELGREASTIVMILAVAMLVQTSPARRFAVFLFVFGVWDIFYYVWLKVLIGWPVSWLEWDILFLIPLPWLGPWLAPFFIAMLFVLWGGWVLVHDRAPIFSRKSVIIFCFGAMLGLGSFLQPILAAMASVTEGNAEFRPESFGWWLYFAGLLLMTVGLLQSIKQRDSV